MKMKLKIIGFIILTLLIGCDQQEEELTIDKRNFIEEYEPFNVDAYKAMIEKEVIEATEYHSDLLNKINKLSYSSSTTPKSKNTKIYVPDDYSTVQEAVYAAPEGAEIIIKGNFNEVVYIVFRNNLTLKGINDASIESTEFTIVLFASNNIQIKDLRIRGHIFMRLSENIEIKNNDISGSSRGYGIYMDENTGCTIEGNYIHDLTGDNLYRGGGIYGIFNNDDNEIKGNIITRARLGIELQDGSDNNVIKDNTIIDTRMFGISLVTDCNQNKVYNNSITNAAWGGLNVVFGSNDNDIRGVQINGSNGTPDSWFGPFAVGMGINGSTNNYFNDVTTTNNTVGVGLRSNATHNTFSNLVTSNNDDHGLLFELTADSNTVRESTGENNGACDLKDLGNNNSFIESQFNTTCN